MAYKIMTYRFFFLFLFSACFRQVREPLSLEDSAVLKEFFQVLIEQSEAGYVLYNKKPVCIHAFFHKDPFLVTSSSYKESVALREGARIWDKFTEKDSDTIVHVCKKEDPNIPKFIHLLVINRPLFHHVVKDNLPLFQYVLGPFVTPDNLLSALLTHDQTYCSLLRKDKVLIGEILGFGVQNSLYGSRLENVQEAADEDTPPFLNNHLLVCYETQEYLPLQPGFGCISATQEMSKIEEKMKVSSEKLVHKNPRFIFGWLKDSKEANAYIAELENTQTKIQSLLKSPIFLEKALELFTGKKYILAIKQEFRFQFDKDEVNKVVARGLWEAVHDYDFEYLPYFIEGMSKSEPPHFNIDRLAWFSGYRREFLQGKENLQRADDVFQSLSKDKSLQCIVPQKLYYKILENGHGNTVCNGPRVSLSYSIFSPIGHCLAYQEKVCLNLKNTIPGFAHGVKGMKIGETREVFVHPSLAYGFDTSLEKCIHLRVIVTLLDIQDNSGSISDANCIDLSFLMNPEIMKTRNENYKMALTKKGTEIAIHLKKCKEIDLNLIAEYLKQFYSNQETCSPTTEAEQDLINRVHWNIYFGES